MIALMFYEVKRQKTKPHDVVRGENKRSKAFMVYKRTSKLWLTCL